ncbi:succinate dehydrogenase and fumarate reductase iron-sulfur protein [Arcobacter nitrofigilis DSM 7299]|uniref:Fumarate reductase iron-sulfur subunit n=1 Tax=Arcobacter nitrofigilis (strain ATCC 33309 / DSM 7299 / CCUG 15893 / LMG 7604 / NCTC 12251 / CI) TaxID=572480 RepID=D5V475_ARCNC|nr:2Fe-2S iron-sulfur cluster-binding protein [Arcobacter nitrofigilis]ADG91808.1 succinate dehydrogenase and fumarate reductase iron-sulfur protein [Arcobacter nitrofigilis DSM 7299]
MNISINRLKDKEKYIEEYKINKENITALEALEYIKENIDSTLTYRSGCKSGICGSCSILINDKEVLACKCKLYENITVKPLKNSTIIKDLVVDLEQTGKLLTKSKAFIEEFQESAIKKEDEKLIDLQSNCILCQNCYSSCPVYGVNKDFLGPFALTRVLRYVNDKKEANKAQKLDAIQVNGIWDCTLCGNCTISCPQFIDSKTDIMNLRMKSIQNGYSDPTIQSNDFLNEFNNYNDFDTGFNPNSF